MRKPLVLIDYKNINQANTYIFNEFIVPMYVFVCI